MITANSQIVFLDNAVNPIYKTISELKSFFKNVTFFTQEKDFVNSDEFEKTDVVLINLDLKPNDAISVISEFKSKFINSKPFLVIYSDKKDEYVQEIAFNSGADAFINFHNKPSVLVLFLNNLLRRKFIPPKKPNSKIYLDEEKFLIFNKNVPLQLPKKEFLLFDLLFKHPEKTFSKTEIANLIWNDESVANKRTIDVHIYNIRQQLGKRVIVSQKGKGYKINQKFIL